VPFGGPSAPLIGRRDESAAIQAALAAVGQGTGHLLLFVGEAGIGKTRLIDEALALAVAAGMTTLRARAEELDARRPFGAIAACLGITPTVEDPPRREIARVLFGDLSSWAETLRAAGGHETEFRLVDAMVVLVEELCAKGPVVLALDDLQWADPSTLHVLHRLGRSVGQLPLLLCGALRPAPRSPELTRLLRVLGPSGPLSGQSGPSGPLSGQSGPSGPLSGASGPSATTFDVPPLLPEEVTGLLSAALGATPGPRLVRQAATTGGNPFYVTGLVAALRASGSLVQTATAADIGAVALPSALKLTVLLELSFLPAGVQEMLRTAAVLGSSFTVADLALVLGTGAIALAPSLREAMAAGVLREEGDRLAFRHDLLREALYEDLSRPLRTSMHLEIARVLAGAGAPAITVAEHFVRGASRGDSLALEWLRRAADDATVRAPAVAAELLERALDLFDPVDPGRDELVADLVVALEISGRRQQAEDACVDLLGRRQPPRTEARVRLCMARLLTWRGQFDEALGQATRAEEVDGLSPAQRARVLGVASTLQLAGRLDLAGAESTAMRGLSYCEAHGNAVAYGNCAFTLAAVSLMRARYLDTLDWATKARVTEDDSPDDRMAQGWQHLSHAAGSLLSQALFALDRVPESWAALRGVQQAAQEFGFANMAINTQALAVAGGYLQGEWDDAGAEFDALLDLCADVDDHPFYLLLAAGARALIAVHRGQPDVAEAALSAAAGIVAPHVQHFAVLARARLLESADAPAGALDVLVAGWGTMEHFGLVTGLVLAADLVRLTRVVGAPATLAAEVCQAMDAMVQANPGGTTIRATALRCRGLLEDDAGLLTAASVAFRESPRVFERARVAEEAAGALARAGDAEGARALFDEALEGYKAFDASWDATRAAARMRAHGLRRGGRQPASRPKTGWDALTPSERAVVELVAEGLSNPEVGERLYVSRFTVKRHLSNAMMKLGFTSRMEVVRAATRARAAP
jgi:DNA-binding CsgD family transcriptional regulator